MKDTIKQLFNLIWFCNKVNIPFEVYAFTNEWNETAWNDQVIWLNTQITMRQKWVFSRSPLTSL